MEDVSFSSLKLFYFRVKDTAYYYVSIYVACIVVCILLIYFIVIPQVTQWFSINNEVKQTEAQLETLNNNLTTLANVPTARLEGDLSTVSEALPVSNDFGFVLRAVTDASLASGVSLADYTFDISSLAKAQGGVSPVSLSLIIKEDIEKTQSFMTELKKKLPLSSVARWDGAAEQSTVIVEFFFKNVTSISVDDLAPLPALSVEHTALLKELAAWKTHVDTVDASAATQSGAAPF